jgi:Superfamily I DNA and RNA helicases
LRLVANHDDSMSFQRVINSPKRGIGPGTIEKLQNYADEHSWSLLEAAENIELSPLGAKPRKTIGHFAKVMDDLTKLAETESMTVLMNHLLEDSGYIDDLKQQNNLESQARVENIEELLTVTTQFDQGYEPDPEVDETRLTTFLTELSLVSDQDDIEEEQTEVTLMTLHAAKGLEFPVVFLVGMEEGIFPLGRSLLKEDDLEEERRLAYVGITRAEKRLYLTNAYSRTLYGRTQNNPTSRFVEEINEDALEPVNTNAGNLGGGKQTYRQRRHRAATAATFTSPTLKAKGAQGAEKLNWNVGDKVDHKKWGQGTVVKVNGDGKNAELDVAFDSQGIKRLLAEYAPIKKVTD